MKYYMGVDAGGSKTHALIIDETGKAVGVGSSGNGNHQIDYQAAKNNIHQATSLAMQQAGLNYAGLEFVYFGLAGADRESDLRILNPMIRELGFIRYDICCDTFIGLRAGTDKSYGVVVVCGSGTNCAGKNASGVTFQCGGFDYMYGDFGGGGDLCVEVFRTVIRSWEGREQETLLTEMLLNELGYSSVEMMFNDYLDRNLKVPIHVTKLLFPAASKGDAAALEILQRQGRELSKSVTSVIKKLGMEQDSFDVVLAGSVLTRGDDGLIRNMIIQAVHELAPRALVTKLTIEPVVGAVWLAVEASGGTVHQQTYENCGFNIK